MLQEAQRVIREALSAREGELQEAESLAMQIAAVARVKGTAERAQQIRPHRAALEYLLGEVRTDSDTAVATVKLTGLLGVFDALVMLDRAVPELPP